MAGLYPKDDLQALYCDEVMDALEDVSHYIVQTFGLQKEELRLAREKLVEGWLSVYLRGLDELLARGGGQYFADNGLTMADLKTFVQIRSLCLQKEELRLAREKLVEGWLSVYLRGLDELLARGGGQYFADNGLTMADLKTFVQIRSLCSGTLDHVPTNLVQRLAPGLVEHQERIEGDPRVAAYYATRA